MHWQCVAVPVERRHHRRARAHAGMPPTPGSSRDRGRSLASGGVYPAHRAIRGGMRSHTSSMRHEEVGELIEYLFWVRDRILLGPGNLSGAPRLSLFGRLRATEWS